MARNSNRIDPVLNMLRSYWLQNPDLRLGQLVDNMARVTGSHVRIVEDDKMMEAFKELTDPPFGSDPDAAALTGDER